MTKNQTVFLFRFNLKNKNRSLYRKILQTILLLAGGSSTQRHEPDIMLLQNTILFRPKDMVYLVLLIGEVLAKPSH